MIRARDALLLAVLAAVLFVWPLHAPPITTRGEAREAMVVRDMARSGHWVLGYRLGVVASKPPFYHWLALLPVRVVGPSAAAVRLPSALGAWTMAAATLAGGTALGGPATGWLAVGVLAATRLFWESALEARVDMVFAAAVTVALAAFLCWWRGSRAAPPIACWAAMTCAVLTKGPAGAVVPALVIVTFLALERQLGLLRRLWSWPAALASAAVVLGWYGLAWRTGGRQFVAVQLLRENVDRLVGTGAFHARRQRVLSLLKLEGAFAVHLFPWSLVVPWSLWRWWRGEREDAGGRFLHVWWVVVLATFSVAAGKRGVYLLPLYPPIALLVARVLAPVVARGGWRARGVVAGVLALALVAAVGVQALRVRRAHRDAGLVAFAREVQRLVPAGVPLRAVRTFDEDDYVTLGWLLDRPLERTDVACPPGAFVLEPGARTNEPAIVAASERRGRRLRLRRCAATPVSARPGPPPTA
ncbi:MAG: glycosyltransferase family 39 protein [Candidatus Binatia bacterium]